MELKTPAYTVKRSRRHTVGLHLSPTGDVMVSAPYFAPQLWIARVVQKHWPWVLRKQAQLAAVRARYPEPRFATGDLFPLWGRPVTLKVEPVPGLTEPRCLLETQTLCVDLPDTLAAGARADAIRESLREWYWDATTAAIHEQIHTLAAIMQVTYRTIQVVDQKSRWGSCSRLGHLRFNGRLSFFPPEALEYVIIHELAHLREANHSPRFWAIVAEVLPDFKARRRLLSSGDLRHIL